MPSPPVLRYAASASLPTPWAEFTVHAFGDEQKREYLALSLGTLDDGEPVLTRIHSSCVTGDALHSLRCDCRQQLALAQQRIGASGRGLLLYLPQEGRGIGLSAKISAYQLQDGGEDTVSANLSMGLEADARDYSICLPLLQHFGVQRVRLMTNNPRKVEGLRAQSIDVVERLDHHVDSNQHNRAYLEVKKNKLGHYL